MKRKNEHEVNFLAGKIVLERKCAGSYAVAEAMFDFLHFEKTEAVFYY